MWIGSALTELLRGGGAAAAYQRVANWRHFLIAMAAFYLLESGPLRGPVAQLVRAGDSSHQVRLRRKAQNERDEFRETLTVRLMAILSQAASTLADGAETTWGLERP